MSHCTADIVAVSRVLKVAQLVQEFETQPDISSCASVLMANMQRCPEGLVERRTLETVSSRFVTEARPVGMP